MIEDFRELRRDGIIIRPDMEPEDILKLGKPEQVIKLEWRSEGKTVAVEDDRGILSQLSRDKKFVATLQRSDMFGYFDHIAIYNSEANIVSSLDNSLSSSFVSSDIRYAWIEEIPNNSKLFRVIAQVNLGTKMHAIHIEYLTGKVVSVLPYGY